MSANAEKGLLKNKSFLYLISAQMISKLGDWLDLMALYTLVGLKWEASPLAMSFIALSLAIPRVVLSPFTGVWADRLDRKKIMIVANLSCMVLVLGLAWASSIWMIYILLIFKGAFISLFNPAKNGKLREIVPTKHMEKAVSISTLIDNSSKVLGPAISGVLVAAFGVYVGFYADAATFLLAALLLLGVPASVHHLKKNEQAETKQKKPTFTSQLKEGLGFVTMSKGLLYGLVLLVSSMFILQLADSQFVILLREVPDVSAELVGVALGTSGFGMVVASLILGKKSFPPFLVMGLGAFIMGTSFAGMGWLTSWLDEYIWQWGPLLFFFAGGAAAMIFIPFSAFVQKQTPVEMTGRVFGTIDSLVTLAVILGPLLGGIIATAFGVIPLFIFSGSFLLLLGIVTLIRQNTLFKQKPSATDDYEATQAKGS